MSSDPKGGSTFQRSVTCLRGMTSVCPGVAGSFGKNAIQLSASHTISTERSSPRAIAQKSQSFILSSNFVITCPQPLLPPQSNRPYCYIRHHCSTCKNCSL